MNLVRSLLLSIIGLSSVLGADCFPKDAQGKEVTAENSLHFDLSPLRRSANDKMWTVDGLPPAITSFELNVCDQLYGISGMERSAVKIMTSTQPIFISPEDYRISYYNNNLSLEYTHGKTCKGSEAFTTKINFTCDKNVSVDNLPSYNTQIDECTFSLSWKTPHACPSSHSNSSSNNGRGFFGIIWLLIKISFWVFVMYMIVHTLYLTFFLERKGTERVPHFEVWVHLLQQGANKITSIGQNMPTSYNRSKYTSVNQSSTHHTEDSDDDDVLLREV